MEKTIVTALVILLAFGTCLYGVTVWLQLLDEQPIRQTTTAIVPVPLQQNVPTEKNARPDEAVTVPSKKNPEVREEKTNVQNLTNNNDNKKQKTSEHITDTVTSSKTANNKRHSSGSSEDENVTGYKFKNGIQMLPDPSRGYRDSLEWDRKTHIKNPITKEEGMLNKSSGPTLQRKQQQQEQLESYHFGPDVTIRPTSDENENRQLSWFLLRKTEASSFLQSPRRRKRSTPTCTYQMRYHQTPELDCANECRYEELEEYRTCIETFDIREFARSFRCRTVCGQSSQVRCETSDEGNFYKLSNVNANCITNADYPGTDTPEIVNGGIGQWGLWRPCSVTCGGGTQTRYRRCSNPLPSGGGLVCTEDREEEQNCSLPSCPVNGGWGTWNPWTTCSKTCEVGETSRNRSCDSPLPSQGGVNCTGDSGETETCNNHTCPVNGGWGSWDSWETCTTTCGDGKRKRTRSCDSPAPSDGGVDCVGGHSETSPCSDINCPVNGAWGSWGSWTTCSKTCGGGEKSRNRSCDSPSPSYGGVDCVGDSGEMETCNGNTCPVNGEWGTWHSWMTCSKTCGGGTKSRRRSCDSPAPSDGGVACVGTRDDSSTCNDQPCPVDGGWGLWNPWLTCSKNCGSGVRSRTRSCESPPPSHGGADCVGITDESSTCNGRPCAAKSEWSSWLTWGACSVINDNAMRTRCRKCYDTTPQYDGSACFGSRLESDQCTISAGRSRRRCRCKCSKLGVETNVSVAQLEQMMEKTKQELTVDKTQTSIAIRKKVSSPDQRTSAQYIGGVGIVMIALPLLFLVTLDLLNVFHFVRSPRLTAVQSPSHEEPTAVQSLSQGEPSAVQSPSQEEPTAVQSPSQEEPTAVQSPSHEEPTAVQSPSHEEPSAVQSPSHEEPTVVQSPSHEEPTVVQSPSHEEPTVVQSPNQEELVTVQDTQ